MKILVFSMATMMKDVSMGGSQRHLRELVLYFAKQGHTVTVLTNRRRDNSEPFQLAEGVKVLPILRFKETFPIPYDTYPFYLAHSYETIRAYAREHDVFYIHDAQMDYGYLHGDIPTVASLKNFTYPEAMISAFHTNRDQLIVACDYTYECVKATVGRVVPQLTELLTVIKNGIDLSIYRPTRSDWREHLGIQQGDLVVLFPHRPDVSKGIFEAFQVVQRLKKQLSEKQIKLLMPQHFDLNVSPETASFYEQLKEQASELQIADALVYYPWLPGHEMPAIYSIADVTLCIGNFIEAFGYVQIESIACGTPAVVSNVGAQRSVVPDGYFVEKVDYGDIEAATNAVLMLVEKKVDVERVHHFLQEAYSYEGNLASYEQLITSAVCRERNEQGVVEQGDRYRLAPWCYLSHKGIYHDYRYEYMPKDELYKFLLKQGDTPFTFSEAMEAAHITEQTLQTALQEGILAPAL